MPATETKFENLNDANFFEWKIYMEALLTKKGLLQVVDGSQRHPGGTEGSKKVKDFYRKQAEARAEIILHVTPSQLSHCREKDPMLIWNSLETIHASRGRSTIISLRRRFHRLRLDRSETISAYISRVRHIAFLLEEADVPVSDDDLILAITSGLPHSYDSFLISLDATPDSEYTLPTVIARLVNEYQRQHAFIPAPRQQNTTDQIEEAMAITTGPHLTHITCFNCGKKGHYQANCPARSGSSTPTTNLSKEETHFVGVDEDDDEFVGAF